MHKECVENFVGDCKMKNQDGVLLAHTDWLGCHCYAAIGYRRSGIDFGEWKAVCLPGQLQDQIKEKPEMKKDMLMAIDELRDLIENIEKY